MKCCLLTAFSSLLLAPGSFAIVDTNNNGVSDFWERSQNNGELFPANFDPQADSDSDGWINAQEAAAGTDPFDPNPPDGLIRPEIAHIPAVLGEPDENGIPGLGSPETVTVTWPTLVGKQYTLLFSPGLTEGSWIPVGDPFIACGGVCKYDFYEVSAADKCFWRVSVGDVDSDSDGLSNHEEFELGTSSSDSDSDSDGLPDAQEVTLGTAPNNPDTDGDGISDAEEVASGHDPKSNQSFPPRWVSTWRGGYTMGTPAIVWAGWDTDLSQAVYVQSGPITVATLVAPLAGLGFPPLAPDASPLPAGYSTPSGVAGGYRDAWGGGELSQARCWLQSKPAVSTETKRTVLRVTTGIRQPYGPEKEETSVVEKLEVVIPANATQSEPIDLLPTFATLPNLEEEQQISCRLLPVEVAPEVLAVNPDFDEGRIDPATGYAIPDCDDIAGVDLKTGSGNTKLELDAERNHLDGTFTQGEDVVDDLHKGWFGVNPSTLGDDFWDGANVTIRKIGKDDPDTGYKESGQVRFYAKWSGGYYGITSYDFQTLQPVNLVSAGVNLRPNEGVYGANSTIPDGAEFYMEGARPGKITLEWRLQKGNIDVKHEQTFMVETRKTRDEWREEVVSQIRLQTKVKSGTEVDLRTYDPNLGFYGDLGDQTPKVRAIYYYYRQLFQQMPEKFMWAGMAKVAAAPIYAGMSDLTEWYHASEITPGTGFGTRDPGTRSFINNLLLSGQKRIFEDMAWTHRAYQASGIWAIKQAVILENDTITDLAAWRQIDRGIQENLQSEINGGNKDLLNREQRDVVQRDYNAITTLRLRQPPWYLRGLFGAVGVPEDAAGLSNAGEWLSANSNRNPLHPAYPYTPKFRTTAPGGRLDTYLDRWAWTSNATSGMLEMWIGSSTDGPNFDTDKRMAHNNMTMYQAAFDYANDPPMLPND